MSINRTGERSFEDTLEERVGEVLQHVMGRASAVAIREAIRGWRDGSLNSPADLQSIALRAVMAATREFSQPE